MNRAFSKIWIGVIAIILLTGGILVWQYFGMPKEKIKIPEEKIEKETANRFIDFSHLDRDELLQKLFPNVKVKFENGIANLGIGFQEYPGYKLYLKEELEDYFINPQKKNLLLIAELEGAPGMIGIYHAFIGIFDENGNLLTPPSIFPNDGVDFLTEPAHFGGDYGEYKFLECRGAIKYIVFVLHACPLGSCCPGWVKVVRAEIGGFREQQEISDFTLRLPPEKENLRIILSEEKIILKKVPAVATDGFCPEKDYKELRWNKESCRFE